jgi:HEPN domain-containing protein
LFIKDRLPAEIPQEWIRYAKSNLRMAEIALGNPGILLEDACFHAQQCAEKALKGLLTKLNIPFPRTHAIEVLLDLLANAGIEVQSNIDDADTLTQYAVQTRYPGKWEEIDSGEAERAVLMATNLLKWVNELVVKSIQQEM